MKNKPALSTTLLIVGNAVLILMVLYLYYSIKPFNITKKIVGVAKNTYYRFFGKSLCPNCNIILVSLDTLSANHLPCYGYARNTSPNLCKFGKENILFNNVYSNATFTLPSTVSMFTGLLPSKHGVNVSRVSRLSSNIPFLPQILKKNGYKTLFNMVTNDPHLPIDKVYNRGIDHIIPPNSFRDLWEKGFKNFRENNEKGEKTFLFLHTYFVHSPYIVGDNKPLFTNKKFDSIPVNQDYYRVCTKDFISFVKSTLSYELSFQYWGDRQLFYRAFLKKLSSIPDLNEFCEKYFDVLSDYRTNYIYSKQNINTFEKVEYIKALYDQKIVELDELLVPLFKFIRQDGIRQNTILIITADHGEEFMEHGETQHITLYDSNARIPLIVFIPGIGNKNVNTMSQNIDILPTILDLVGVKHNYLFQGKSLVEDILKMQERKEYIVSEKVGEQMKTIRNEKYKLFLKQVNVQLKPYLLFDTEKDPSELQNIIFSHEDKVNELQKQINEIIDF